MLRIVLANNNICINKLGTKKVGISGPREAKILLNKIQHPRPDNKIPNLNTTLSFTF